MRIDVRSDIPLFAGDLPAAGGSRPLHTDGVRSKHTPRAKSRVGSAGQPAPKYISKLDCHGLLSRRQVSLQTGACLLGAQRGTNVERGVIVGGVLICVSFLLAVFLNHWAGERSVPPRAAMPPQSTPKPLAALPAAVPSGGAASAECLGTTAKQAEVESQVLGGEQCAVRQP